MILKISLPQSESAVTRHVQILLDQSSFYGIELTVCPFRQSDRKLRLGQPIRTIQMECKS